MFFTILLFCKFFYVQSFISPPTDLYMGCLSLITKTYFVQQPTVTIFTTNSVKKSVIHNTVASVDLTVKLKNLNILEIDWFEGHKKYAIVLTKKWSELDDVLLKKLNYWNPRATYIFQSENPEEDLNDFVKKLWKHYLVDVIIFSYVNDEVVDIYTYFPYSENNCANHIDYAIINSCINGSLEKNDTLFPRKIPIMDFRQCPLIIRGLVYTPYTLQPEKEIKDYNNVTFDEGVEIRMIETIAKAVNFKIRYTLSRVVAEWGLVYPNGSTTGNMDSVATRAADISLGITGPTIERHRFLDHNYCHLQEYCTWCVPKARIAPAWRGLLDIFQYLTWIAMIAMYILISVLIWAFASTSPRDPTTYPLLKNSMNYIFSIFLNVSTYETPVKKSARMIFIFWVIFGLHFTIAYQAKLISVLTNTVYEKQMDTVDEMLNSNMPFLLIYTLKRYFANTDDWRVKRISDNFQGCYDSDACLNRIAYQRNLAFFTLKVHMDFDTMKYVDSTGRPLIYCFDNYYLVYPAQMYLTKGFPLRDRIDQVIFRIRDSGLLLKWKSDVFWKWRHRFLNSIPLADNSNKPLTIKHLLAVFFVAAVGYCFALLVFVIEILIFYINKRRNKNKKKRK